MTRFLRPLCKVLCAKVVYVIYYIVSILPLLLILLSSCLSFSLSLYIYIHTHIHIYIYIHTHIYIYICTSPDRGVHPVLLAQLVHLAGGQHAALQQRARVARALEELRRDHRAGRQLLVVAHEDEVLRPEEHIIIIIIISIILLLSLSLSS